MGGVFGGYLFAGRKSRISPRSDSVCEVAILRQGSQNAAADPAHALQKIADGLPAFGIVAAVMGVVHTMESVGLPPQELGILIAHALVGTFLGILLSYGFVAPLVGVLEKKAQEASKALECIKVTLLASLNDAVPTVAVEFGRKVLYSTERPGFAELEKHVKGAAKSGAKPGKK